MLLPPDENQNPEEAEADPRAELVKRLLEYKKFKEAASELSQRESTQKHFFSRVGPGIKIDDIPPAKDEFFEASLFDLITAFTKVLKDVPKDAFYQVVKDEFTVSEKIHDILHLMAEQKSMMFFDLFKGVKNKFELIVTFLALLELIKMRELVVRQPAQFDDIEIIRNTEAIKPTENKNG
jgi:segregation and condensation protein A